jgi:predicted  nucleic acid-binding Zn-ribbon protein
MNDEAIPMRRREPVVETDYAPRPRAKSEHYAAARDEYARLELENNEQRHELDRMRNALHVSELRNVDLIAKVKSLELEADDLKDRLSRVTTRLNVGAEQFLAALKECNTPLSMNAEANVLAAVENEIQP